MTIKEIDIRVNTKKAERNVTALDKDFRALGKSADGAVKFLGKLSKGALAVAAAITAATVATIAMVRSSAEARRETEQLARLVGISADKFNALAFATNQYGIDAGRIADISKDVSEKVSEFAAAGTGTFQDYADVMKLTKEQAASTALEFENLSGDKVLGLMVKRMEEAGVSGGRISFALESMGNDATKLIPLLSNNASELTRLTQGFNALNAELSITSEQNKELIRLTETFDLMTGTATSATTAISASLAPAVSDLIKLIAEGIPPATVAITDFINSLKSADDINSIESVTRQIEILKGVLIDLSTDSFLGFDLSRTQGTSDAIDRTIERINKLKEQLASLQEESAVIAPPIAEGSGGGEGGDDSVKAAEAQATLDRKTARLFAFFENERASTEKHLQDIFDIEVGFKTQTEVDEENRYLAKAARIEERKIAGILLAGEDELLKIDIRDAANEADLAATAEHEQKKTDIARGQAEERSNLIKSQFSSQLSITANAFNAFASLSSKDSKKQRKLQKAAIIANTAVAVVKSYNNGGGYPWGIVPAIAMAVAGAAQLKKIGGGGGGISAHASAVTSSPQQSNPTAQAQQRDVQRVIDIRVDDNAVFTGKMVKDAMTNVLQSDSDYIVNFTEAQNEAKRLGQI